MSDRESQSKPDYEDQDSEPTMKAPDEGRPDGTIAPERGESVDEGRERGLADEDHKHERGEHIGPPE